MSAERIAVIGDGGWGTALALSLESAGHSVTVWGPFPDYAREVGTKHENRLYLPGISLPREIRWTANPDEAVADAAVVVLAIPTQYFRATLKRFTGLIPACAQIVSVAKGLDSETLDRMSRVAETELQRESVAALSGPSLADEVARGIPTAVVIASRDAAQARALQSVFGTPRLRVYTSDDVVGVELGGALKNVIAVAVGTSDGLGFGGNTRAAIITRGLAEITRLGVALGAHPITFSGLSGLGDLIVTCTSQLSRNHSVGEKLGRGEKLADILGGMKQVAEGVPNSRTALKLAQSVKVDTPIIQAIYSVLYENLNPRQAVTDLMGREARPERD
jgi:glycerol-3-phosphate dehydrogenase (NAD(P)+)